MSKLISSLLAAVASVLAILAAVSQALSLPAVGRATLEVETWRVVGLFTFAALFALLAFRPLVSPALWVIVIANKAALAVIGLVLGPEVPGALDAVVWDGALVVLLVAGFIASRVAARSLPR